MVLSLPIILGLRLKTAHFTEFNIFYTCFISLRKGKEEEKMLLTKLWTSVFSYYWFFYTHPFHDYLYLEGGEKEAHGILSVL